MPRHRVFGSPRAAPQRVSARRSTLNAVYRLTGLPVARGAARGSPCPRDIVDAPRSARLPARDRKRRSRGHLNVADVIAAEATRRRGSGSAVSTRCGPVRVDRASRRLAGPATRARATAGRAVGSLAGAGHLRARRVASWACRWRIGNFHTVIRSAPRVQNETHVSWPCCPRRNSQIRLFAVLLRVE